MGTPWWRPKNGVEREMLAALRAGDTTGYLRLVGTTALYLPQLVDRDGDAERRSPILREIAGVPAVMVFSSPETMAVAAGDEADVYTRTSFPELRAGWPDPAWRLAVNAGAPIAAFPSVAAVERALAGEPAAAAPPDGLPIVDPAAARLLAVIENDVDSSVEELLGAMVTVPTRWQVGQPEDILDGPWHVADRPDGPAIEAFTGTDAVASSYPHLPNVRLAFPVLLSLLPERAAVVVDPGGPGELALRGERLVLAMIRANDRFPARALTTTPRPPRWHLDRGDPIGLAGEIYPSPPPGTGSVA